ncbi:SusC/RagA family TonB-linked outer membrane protein [Rufibacter sediminis]|uniref:TonB-dependent receptor n=1 Tax=Rufibacter sediminis TaxID=2762756 RepID=A0ABR6VSI5_9BACT|nr:TonB-dependent receptor [Rufibacter sediminis]MBC3540139.1 TonB-dependent receptor [Rufibacter sediminis]
MKWKFTNRLLALSGSVFLCTTLPSFHPGAAFAGVRDYRGATFQDRPVSGVVTSADDGSPLVGVSVSVKGGTAGVMTDVQGKYQISVPNNAVLVFSYIGYSSQEVPVSNRSQIDLKLATDRQQLDEVVVIGYGTQRKGDVTSAVAGVDREDFVQGAVRDAAQLVQGKVAGLRVTTPSGDPNGNTQINLRGISSIQGSSSPLVIIDGVPGDLNTVAPEDIESVDVLKDGSAAAIYGTRATGGVILITTRKTQGERSTIEYNAYTSVQTIARRPELLTGDDYRRLIKEEGIDYEDYGGNTDWLDEIMQTPVSHNHNLTFFGGNSTTNFTGSLNYRNWEGIMKRTGQERFVARADVNHSMFDDKLKANIQLINRVRSSVEGGGDGYAYRQAIIRNPTDRVRTETGEWQERDAYFYLNPVSRIEEFNEEYTNREMRMSGSLDYSPIKDLHFKILGSHIQENSLYGYASTFNHSDTWLDNRNSNAGRDTDASRSNLLELTSNYAKTMGAHSFSLLGGYSWQDETNEGFNADNWNFPTDAFGWNNLGAGQADQAGLAGMGSYKENWKLIGFFGRVTYSWNDKYLFMASVRREGSSKFGVNYQWGTFPAVSVGWRVSQEEFMKSVGFVSDLKIRAGYGVTGTIANRPYLSQISYRFEQNIGAFIGGKWVPGFEPARNFNPDLRWEKKGEYNVGIDFGFLKNRISGSLDFFRRDIEDLLYNFEVPRPPYLVDIMAINAGALRSQGFEALVNFVPVETQNFSWNSNVTYSTNKTKLVSLTNDQFDNTIEYFDAGYTGEPIQDFTHRVAVGEPIGRFYVWKTVGVDANGGWLVESRTGEAIPYKDATQEDRQYYGNAIPKHVLGWNNSARYKNFDMTVNIRGAFGHNILNFQRMFYENPINSDYNMLKTAYDPVYGKRLNNDLVYVSHYIEKGDYVKIDNVTFGYTLPKDLIKIVRNARVFVSGLNLVTITGYKGLDPEGVSYSGFAPGNDERDKYPTTRTFTAGINVSF